MEFLLAVYVPGVVIWFIAYSLKVSDEYIWRQVDDTQDYIQSARMALAALVWPVAIMFLLIKQITWLVKIATGGE